MEEIRKNKEIEDNTFSEAIIVLGSGISIAKTKSGYKLSWDERMRLNAASEYFDRSLDEGGNPLMILCGGEVFKDHPEISSIAQEEAIRRLKIPLNKIERASKSLNTVSDINDAIEIMKEKNIQTGVVISSEYHLTAKELAFKKNLDFIPAEELLLKRHRLYQRLVSDLRQSSAIKDVTENQKVRIYLLMLPFGEKIYSYLSDASLSKRAIITDFDPDKLTKLKEG